MIALATAMFSETENLQAYLEDLLDTEVPVFFQQDNETVLAILKAGYSGKASTHEPCSPCQCCLDL